MSLRAAIIGLGRIGSRYDHGSFAHLPQSHAGAILQSEGYELVAAVDEAPQAREQFLADWKLKIPVYASVDELLRTGPYDLISIAVPAALQFQVLQQCLTTCPRLIFCEKPFCSSLTEAEEIVALAKAKATPILVNYHRRWDSKMRSLQTIFAAQDELPRQIQARYSKGLLNYGSHLVNLLQFFFGTVQSVTGFPPCWPERNPDPSFSFVLDMEGGPQAVVTGANDLKYEFLDLSVLFRDCEYRLGFGGFEIEKFTSLEHSEFSGYITLQRAEAVFPDGPVHGLSAAYEEISEVLCGRRIPVTNTAESALETHRVLEAIRRSANARSEGIRA